MHLILIFIFILNILFIMYKIFKLTLNLIFYFFLIKFNFY